uniref:Helicase C-terminal domain-containing protein n=1 Tax=viral metagenome TaxID=1070528 RepID=A0A6C0DPK9_9ZZZZ
MSYVLPNRKAFVDSITRIFLKYRQKDMEGTDGKPGELYPYQKLVRDYLLIETPYRGLLVYHGLGSGKTCSAIAVAESLMTNKKVFVLLPASLKANFIGEIRSCGDPVYKKDSHWEEKKVRTEEDRDTAKSMGISEEYLDKNGRYFMTVQGAAPNFRTLSLDQQKGIDAQIDDLINSRFTFINYNGILESNVDRILHSPHMFDDSVVIVEEAHNLIGAVINESELKRKLYDMIYKSQNCKVVALSGTPTINRPQEIAFLMNLLRGPIERVMVPTKSAMTWDEALMTAFFRQQKDVDTIEYNSVKHELKLTRNPPYFESVYNDKGDRIAVKYSKEFKQEPDIKKWASEWKTEFENKFAGVELLGEDKMGVENLECLPTEYEDFMKTFVDGLNIKNALLLGRRIQGLVSYYKGADEKLIPKRLDEDKTLQKIEMSDEQYLRYLEARKIEIDREAKKNRNPSLNDELGSYRMTSRLVCNFAVPPEFKYKMSEEGETEYSLRGKPIPEDKLEILKKIDAEPERFLTPKALPNFSPKMAQMLKDLKSTVGKDGEFNNQFVYSEYKSLEGLGLFKLILNHNGFQPYKLKKEGGQWREGEMEKGVPAYASYTGDEDEDEREMARLVFNGETEKLPSSLKDSLKERKLCIMMGTKAAAEGITLKNVRNVYIMEPYWNPARIEQVIGRAIRVNSHSSLPEDQRNVTVKLYMSVFSAKQLKDQEGPNITQIRRNDTTTKRYEGNEPIEAFLSSDEVLYDMSYKKGKIIKGISTILKQAAVDCEIHRKLHSKEQPVIQCMRFDTSVTAEDLAYRPSYLNDEKDTLYRRNLIPKRRKLQIIKVKGMVMILDPKTNEIFDYSAFQDNQRLFQIGSRSGPNAITFFPHVV